MNETMDDELACEICSECYCDEENQETEPLMLSCPCRKTLCRGCIIKRLGTDAFCPWCKQRWSVRNFVQQCESLTPRDYYQQIRAKAASNVNSSPLRLDGNLVPLGAGALREYYLRSMENVQKDAEARSAEQIQIDEELARQYEEERQLQSEKKRQLEEEDAKLAQSIAEADQQHVNSSSASSSSSSDNRRKDSTRTSSSGARITTLSSSSSSSSSRVRRSSKPPNNGSSLLTFFAKDDGGNSNSNSNNNSNSQNINNRISNPAGIDENQHPTGTQSNNNKECLNQPSSLVKKRPVLNDPDIVIIERSNNNCHSNNTSKTTEQKPLQQQVVTSESHNHNKRSKQHDQVEPNWVCTTCTYAFNPALYLLCDCCQAERQASNTSSSSSAAASSSQENVSHLAF